MESGYQHGFIAGNVGLGRQHIKALCTGGARRGFEGEGGDATLSQFGNGFIAERIEHAHHDSAAFDQSPLAVAGSDDLENQLCAERIDGAANGRTYCLIGTVDNAGANAGAALHSDFMTLADQLLDGFRGCSNPRFTRLGFERNTNAHLKSPVWPRG
ncbi:hypothetical protein PS691_04225 [Pseudomonas fluorescens]|uniref:Uncharacterized protein n=1 Tax=Pseudomonas fluorescens TaxID=294 RepID=A0A5E7E127_PSEFL|nr:hypothetical protein PS691_04225 [Pseudomonas fluorescens]